MKIENLKPFLKPLELAGIKINDFIPSIVKALKSYSQKVGKKCYFFFSEKDDVLIFSIYGQNENGSLDQLHSYEVKTIENIFSIIENLQNEPEPICVEPATTATAGASDTRTTDTTAE